MARKSKSSKNPNKTGTSNGIDPIEVDAHDAVESTESSTEDAPVIIEAEAIEVTAADEKSTEASPAPEDNDTIEVSAAAEDSDNEDHAESSPDDADEQKTDTDKADSVDPVAAAPTPEPARSSPLPLVLGGLVAGGLGYLAATFAQPTPVDTSALSKTVATNEAELKSLTSTVADLQSAPAADVDLGDIDAALSDISIRLDGLDGDLASVRDEIASVLAGFEETSNTLRDRLTVLETAGPGDTEEARVTEQDLAAFRSELQRMTTEAEERVAQSLERASEIEAAAMAAAAEAEQSAADAEREAAEAAAMAEREAAIAVIKTAVESGQSFTDEIGVLDQVPEVLVKNAESGIITLVELQQTYADAARSALANSEVVPQDASAGDRLVAFFKQRTNARSLTPIEGDSANAVLSRAESAMQQGDLSEALAELEGLEDGPKAAMQDWLNAAKSREAALAAVEQLTATN